MSADFEKSEAGQAAERERIAKLEAEGAPHGLSVAQVEMAKRCGMSLAEYSAMRFARTVHDYDRIRRQLKAEAAKGAPAG